MKILFISDIHGIDNNLKRIEKIIEKEIIDKLVVLGDLYYELIMIHPFREGNGRTIREFLREFVKYKITGYELLYSKINKDNFLLGITERDTYPLLLAYEINNALIKNKEEKKMGL